MTRAAAVFRAFATLAWLTVRTVARPPRYAISINGRAPSGSFSIGRAYTLGLMVRVWREVLGSLRWAS